MDRLGKPLSTVGEPGVYLNLALSQDGQRVAVSYGTGSPLNFDIWLIDLARPAMGMRLTTDPAGDFDPVLSPIDGSQVVFNSTRTGTDRFFYRRGSSGGGHDELLLKPDTGGATGGDWSRDGRFFAYMLSNSDVWVPRWRGDGKEIFFLAPDGMLMAAGIDTTKGFQSTVPQPLFQTGITSRQAYHPYVVADDGRRFLLPVSDRSEAPQINVVLNWLATAQK